MLFRLLLVLIGISLPALSEELVLRVAIPADEEEVGAFLDFQRISDLLKKVPVQVKPLKVPIRRAHLMFFHGQVDCILDFPENSGRESISENYLSSPPLSSYLFFFFVPEDASPLKSVDEVQKLVIGAPKRHEYFLGPFIKDVHVEWARSEAQLVKMLEMNRIDAMLAALPYMESYQSRLRFAPAHPLASANNHLICRNTETNLRLLNGIVVKEP